MIDRSFAELEPAGTTPLLLCTAPMPPQSQKTLPVVGSESHDENVPDTPS
jgi:hypothetical protein